MVSTIIEIEPLVKAIFIPDLRTLCNTCVPTIVNIEENTRLRMLRVLFESFSVLF